MMNNIFGKRMGTTFEVCMVDAVDTDDFQHKLSLLEAKWKNLATPSSLDLEEFLQWFAINKVDLLKNTTSKRTMWTWVSS